MNPASLQAMLNGDFPSAILAATPGGIERQEAEGQAQLVKEADRLPYVINHPRNLTHAKISEKTGIKFGKPVDSIFIEATLPDGWKLVPSNHSMWSSLEDERGFKRASIFYKAAFYDRNAHVSFETRYRINGYIENGDPDSKMRACAVIDTAVPADTIAKILWQSEFAGERDFDKQDALLKQARAWLEEHFPQHDDPFAYWS